jgi:hypothetical protein
VDFTVKNARFTKFGAQQNLQSEKVSKQPSAQHFPEIGGFKPQPNQSLGLFTNSARLDEKQLRAKTGTGPQRLQLVCRRLSQDELSAGGSLVQKQTAEVGFGQLQFRPRNPIQTRRSDPKEHFTLGTQSSPKSANLGNPRSSSTLLPIPLPSQNASQTIEPISDGNALPLGPNLVQRPSSLLIAGIPSTQRQPVRIGRIRIVNQTSLKTEHFNLS